jgi:hypothetical protein
MTNAFSANALDAARILRIGREQFPVIVIDDYLSMPEALVEFAASSARFGVPKNWYPGLRAEPLPQPYVIESIRALHRLVGETFGLPVEGNLDANTYFGLANLPPGALSPLQRLPHFDSANPRQIAVLHYLCGAEHGGTAFYRHRATGFEAIGVDRQKAYYAALDGEMKTWQPPPRYMSGDDALFEEVARFEAKFNRLLIYPSRVLHSANVNAEAGLSADPRAGRLTANIFLAYR